MTNSLTVSFPALTNLVFRLLFPIQNHQIYQRVVFSKEAEPHSRPYQVYIVLMLKGGDAQICGGALISSNYNKEYQITKNYITHKNYEYDPKGYMKHDIALIKPNELIKLSKNIQLINLDDDTCKHSNCLICTRTLDFHSASTGNSAVVNGTVIGVLSGGMCMVFSYYTRVTSYLDWIEDNSNVKVMD
ncbi:hypothetical protein ABEB36_002744 [Hypothenemus hampei]|uniref:Peptidase S1 domain-containing protein n=1 Tax=Hypothenemus hampei TaxID=57062 RepID=A0ABD1F9X8_HYPHA